MPSPIPKPAELRQRRNKPKSRAKLPASGLGKPAPPLPVRRGRRWLAPTRAWWEAIWASPMAAEWLPADVFQLHMLADLVDRYWREPSEGVAREVRARESCFGLTPLDRRRLEWEVEKPEKARAPERATPQPSGEDDPRRVLQMPVRVAG